MLGFLLSFACFWLPPVSHSFQCKAPWDSECFSCSSCFLLIQNLSPVNTKMSVSHPFMGETAHFTVLATRWRSMQFAHNYGHLVESWPKADFFFMPAWQQNFLSASLAFKVTVACTSRSVGVTFWQPFCVCVCVCVGNGPEQDGTQCCWNAKDEGAASEHGAAEHKPQHQPPARVWPTETLYTYFKHFILYIWDMCLMTFAEDEEIDWIVYQISTWLWYIISTLALNI